MTIYRPELINFNEQREVPIKITHPYHMIPRFESVLNQGVNLAELGNKIGAGAVVRSGTFADNMLGALDKVSAYQQFASNMAQTAITDPDSVDAHDVNIAQSKARMALDMSRSVLSRLVQGWRDLINTR